MQILYFVYFLYLARELLTSRAELAFWTVRITSRAELARYLNEPERVEPKRAEPARYPASDMSKISAQCVLRIYEIKK